MTARYTRLFFSHACKQFHVDIPYSFRSPILLLWNVTIPVHLALFDLTRSKMDHLAEPVGGGHIQIPFSADPRTYQPEEFFDFHEAYFADEYGNLRSSLTETTPEVLKELLQSWLFAFLATFLNIPIDARDFLNPDDDTVNTKKLKQFLDEWKRRELKAARLRTSLHPHQQEVLRSQHAFSTTMVFTKQHLAHPPMDEIDLDHSSGSSYVAPDPLDPQPRALLLDDVVEKLALFIIIIGETLQQTRSELIKASTGMTHHWDPLPTEECNWGHSIHCRRRLAENGWCPKDIHRLESTMSGASCIYHASGMRAPGTTLEDDAVRTHHGCSATVCRAPHKVKDVYHFGSCTNRSCGKLSANWSDVDLVRMIKAGETPLITFDSKGLHCTGYDLEKTAVKFGVVSHVWADRIISTGEQRDGQSRRSIHLCHIRELQKGFNRMLSANSSSNTPFWLDTLCMPGVATRQGTALVETKNIYSKAQAVLVWDRSLLEANGSRHEIENNVRIRLCPWLSRLWTFPEAVLNQNLFFKFKNDEIHIENILKARDRAKGDFFDEHHCIEEVCIPLSSATFKLRTDIDEATSKNDMGLGYRRVHLVMDAVQFREATNPADETRVLAHVLDLGPPCIIDTQDTGGSADEQRALRMVNFLEMLNKDHRRGIPSGIVFLPGPSLFLEKYRETYGFGCAPITWLTKRPSRYFDLFGSDHGRVYTLREGFLVRYPGLEFHVSEERLPARTFHVPIRRALDRWCAIALEWPDFDCRRVWTDIMKDPYPPFIVMSTSKVGEGWKIGLLVTQIGSLTGGSVKLVRRHCRVWFREETCLKMKHDLKRNYLGRSMFVSAATLSDETEWCIHGREAYPSPPNWTANFEQTVHSTGRAVSNNGSRA